MIHVVAVLGIVCAGSARAQDIQPEQKSKLKRRDESTDEDLRKQLLLVPEVGLDQAGAGTLLGMLSKATAKIPGKSTVGGNILPDIGHRFYTQLAAQRKNPDLLALPWQVGVDSQIGKETAEKLHVFSINLRTCMRQSVPANDVRPDVDKLRARMAGIKVDVARPKGKIITRPLPVDKPLAWNSTECVPALAQMMQTENTPLRLLMVELLSKVEGKEAGIVLAQRAVFDLSPQVREKAVEALGTRPMKEYLHILLDGMRWPWAPAADHAAEALGTLKLKDALPRLLTMLDEPDPKLPFIKEGKDGKEKVTMVREVVRINHMSNCLLCHAPSQSKEDLVRGRVPVPGQEMPPLYYAESTGQFVRADITYLRQEFSLVQPVNTPGKWPGQQRFDYMLRTRKANPKEVKLLQGILKEAKDSKLIDAYPQREAALFALREITGKDAGIRPIAWQELLNPIVDKK